MQDEIFDRSYQAAREQLNGSIDQALSAFVSSFRRLHELQWQAPWESQSHRRTRRPAGLA